MKKILLTLALFLLVILQTQQATFSNADQLIENLQSVYRSQQYELAEDYFKKGILHSRPEDQVFYRYYLANTLMQLQRFPEAEQEYKKVQRDANNLYQTLIKDSIASQENELRKNYLLKVINGTALGIDIIQKNSTDAVPMALATTNTTSSNKTVIKFNPQHTSITIRDAVLNNRVKANFIFDSGATYTSISRATARQLGINLENTQTITVVTANGPIKVPKVMLESISINGITVRNVEVTIHDITASNDVTGLLGLSFMQHFQVTINRKQGEITLEKIS